MSSVIDHYTPITCSDDSPSKRLNIKRLSIRHKKLIELIQLENNLINDIKLYNSDIDKLHLINIRNEMDNYISNQYKKMI